MKKFEDCYREIVESKDELLGYPSGVCFCGKEGYHLECQGRILKAKEYRNYIESLPSSLGYSVLKDQTDREFVDAEKIIFEKLNVDASYENYSRNKVLEGATAYYFPICWIGSSGHLVIKNTHEVVSFGSYIGKSEHIWAYHYGISIASLGKDRKNDFTICKINDEENTIKVLESFLDAKTLISEIVPRLNNLPLILNDVDLYFGIRDLLKAKYENWFQYKIN